MNMARLEKIIENKYSLLLFFLVLLIALSPLTNETPLRRFYTEALLFLAMILILLRILGAKGVFFLVFSLLALAACFLDYLSVAVLNNCHLDMLSCGTYILYVGVILVYLMRKVFTERTVTADTVKGSIAVYLLMGVWFQLVYSMLWMFDPTTFNLANPSVTPDFFYFSFSTMTTLGYGDIVPKSIAARTAAILQAMAGQMYLTILVARLVGLHIANPKPEE